jgi:endonuclease/exonuclease/phosphatase family metal-dependent hydrolase
MKSARLRGWIPRVFAYLLCIGCAAAAHAGERQRVTVVAFNVLAPIWAGAVWYPPAMHASVLDRAARREAVTAFLRESAATTDVFCLQELNEQEFEYYRAALSRQFVGRMAYNERRFWSDWLVEDIPWEPNGVGVFARIASIDVTRIEDLPLSDAGNRVALMHGLHRSSGTAIRVASVHLDSDSNAGRVRELRALAELAPGAPDVVDVVCGDINEDTRIGSAAGILAREGYVDVLAATGNRAATHPFTDSYYRSARWAIIDHVLTRGATPLTGRVIDFGVWSIEDEIERIEENMRRGGSDHFPIEAVIELPVP